MYGLYQEFRAREEKGDRPVSPLVDRSQPRLPPEPRLQVTAEKDLRQYRADQAFTASEFAGMLGNLLAGRQHIFFTLGEHPEFDGQIAACVREIREVSRRGAAAPVEFVALETTLHEQRLLKTPREVETLGRALACHGSIVG